MAFRKVDGVFWTDPKVRELTEQERYLFLYCMTCPTAHSSGLYYNPLPMISFETGINDKALIKAFGRLREGLMIHYGMISGVVFVKNMLKFQAPNKNEKENISKHLKTIQDKDLLVMFLNTYPEFWQGFDKASLTVQEGFHKDTHTKTNTKTETKTETKTDESEKTSDSMPVLFDDPYSFEKIFKMYGEKGNYKLSKKRWEALSVEKKRLAFEKIPLYVLSTAEQYRKNFETWINQECWNDKILTNKCQADADYKVRTRPDGSPLF
jgi:hypothetical protein